MNEEVAAALAAINKRLSALEAIAKDAAALISAVEEEYCDDLRDIREQLDLT